MSLLGNKKIKVKFLHRGSYSATANQMWKRQFPEKKPIWGSCEFDFDPDARNYDWLVVYHDMPPKRPGEKTEAFEKLACHSSNTMHVNYEPSSITTYGHQYLMQFEHILTSQEPDCVRHPNRIYSQPGLPWFYGRSTSGGRSLNFDEIFQMKPTGKPFDISTVCSKKRSLHTAHRIRYNCTRLVKQEIHSMEVFGYDSKRVDDKAEALDEFKYHLAIENHFAPHHWTEKLADSFLGYCIPIYAGCTNIAEYFPQESFLTLNPSDLNGTVSMIKEYLNSNHYEKVFPAIQESRNRVLGKYNLFAVLSSHIANLYQAHSKEQSPYRVLSRSRMWKEKPYCRLGCFLEKSKRIMVNSFKNALNS